MLLSLLRRLRQIARRIFVRITLIALLAVLALGLALLFGNRIPDGLADLVGAEAVDRILEILASSMLAVTIFSLTIMLTALNYAAAQWTPRSHLILREDTVTHSVLATFLGAYLFSLLAIVMRAADLFDKGDTVVLFFMTLIVVATILYSLIRWIVHLENLGSLPFTARIIEEEAERALQRFADKPCHGGHALTDPDSQIPGDALAIRAPAPGYLKQVFEIALQDIAEEHDLRVYLRCTVGQYVLAGDVIARVEARGAAPDEAVLERLCRALPVEDQRSFMQDPVFGLTVLAEIATKALSPGINDSGTAIDVIHRLTPVLAAARTCEGGFDDTDVLCDRLWAPPLQADALFTASFDPIARCAGRSLEVHLAIQRALCQIAESASDAGLRDAARAMRKKAFERAEIQIEFDPDRALLRKERG